MKRKPSRPVKPEAPEDEVQQSTGRSIARDEKTKRIVRRSPQRDIPRVESVEPPEAPTKE